MSAVFPRIGIELAVDLGVVYAPNAAVWDSGRWDQNQWAISDTALGNWGDVTCDVIDPFTMTAGSSGDGIVARWEAATVAFSLLGTAYDPRSGPYAGLLGPAVPVRVRWRPVNQSTWIIAFLGQTDDDGYRYDPITRRAEVAATDRTRLLSVVDLLPQAPQGFYETAATRVTRLANVALWPTASRDIAAGGINMQATTLEGNAWDNLLKVADTDLALLWVSRAGLLSFRPEGKVTHRDQINAVIACNPVPGAPAGMAPIAPVNIVNQQPVVTRNIVTVGAGKAVDDESDVEPETLTMRDESSVARFFPHAYTATDLLHVNSGWNSAVAAAVLISGAWPSTAPESVELDSRINNVAAALLLGLEPSEEFIVNDGLKTWTVEPIGWQITVSRNGITGTINLMDTTIWPTAGKWDTARWDTNVWGWAH